MDRNELIAWMAGVSKIETVAEVGVYRGAFARVLARTLEPKRLVLVDCWAKLGIVEYPDYPALQQQDWDKIYRAVVRSSLGSRPGCEIVRATSEQAVARFRDGTFDLVYIDANHQYEFVKKDIALWYPKVRSGGWIAGHDYDLAGVKRAVAESIVGATAKHTTKEKATKSWYARKP